MKKRAINIDFVRVILALLVMVIHSVRVEGPMSFYIVNGLARVAVPLFFILTGMSLNRERIIEWCYIKSYIRKQVQIFFPWIALYAFIAVCSFVKDKNILYGGSLFIQFWFVVATWIAITLMHFLLSRFDLKKTLLLAFALHVFGILGDGYLGVTQQIPFLSTFYSLFLAIFFKTRTGLFFGLFYMCLGMYLSRERIWLKLSNRLIVVLIVITLILQYLEINMLLMKQTPHYNMYFTLIPLTSLIICYLKNNESTKKSRINYKRMSVKIYITHTLMIFIVSSYYKRFFTGSVFLPVLLLYGLIYSVLMAWRFSIKQSLFKEKLMKS